MTVSDPNHKFKPCGNWVWFERDGTRPPKKGEIVLSASDPLPLYCTVLGAGPRCEAVRKGQRVLIPTNEGRYVRGLKGAMVREAGVLAIIA